MYHYQMYNQYQLSPVTEQTLHDIHEQTRQEAWASGRGFRVALAVFALGMATALWLSQTGIAVICAIAFIVSALVWREDVKSHKESTAVALYRAEADKLPNELLSVCKANSEIRAVVADLLKAQDGILYQFQVAGVIKGEADRNHSELTNELFGGVV